MLAVSAVLVGWVVGGLTVPEQVPLAEALADVGAVVALTSARAKVDKAFLEMAPEVRVPVLSNLLGLTPDRQGDVWVLRKANGVHDPRGGTTAWILGWLSSLDRQQRQRLQSGTFRLSDVRSGELGQLIGALALTPEIGLQLWRSRERVAIQLDADVTFESRDGKVRLVLPGAPWRGVTAPSEREVRTHVRPASGPKTLHFPEAKTGTTEQVLAELGSFGVELKSDARVATVPLTVVGSFTKNELIGALILATRVPDLLEDSGSKSYQKALAFALGSDLRLPVGLTKEDVRGVAWFSEEDLELRSSALSRQLQSQARGLRYRPVLHLGLTIDIPDAKVRYGLVVP